jgi:hypothetical protein
MVGGRRLTGSGFGGLFTRIVSTGKEIGARRQLKHGSYDRMVPCYGRRGR